MHDPAIRVRPAVGSDAEAVWPLVSQFATSFEPQHEPFRRSWHDLITDPDACLLVAADPSGLVIGYLLGFVHVTLFANGQVAWVEELMVHETARRSGVGASLMRGAEQWATAKGAAYLALATRRAAPFYSALGYVESATFFKKNL